MCDVLALNSIQPNIVFVVFKIIVWGTMTVTVIMFLSVKLHAVRII